MNLRLLSIAMIAFLIGSMSVSCQTSNMKKSTEMEGSVAKDIDAEIFKSMIGSENSVLLDVRTEAEVSQGKIEGALVIDFRSPEFKSEITKLDKDKKYLVYCRSGNRSGQAMKMMNSLGFSEVYNLSGGYMNWPYK